MDAIEHLINRIGQWCRAHRADIRAEIETALALHLDALESLPPSTEPFTTRHDGAFQ